jgi:IS605 OrfB family transposase
LQTIGFLEKMFLTIPTKIHNPSQRKRMLLETAFKDNTRAYDYILSVVKGNLEEIRKQFYWTDSRGKERLVGANRAAYIINHLCDFRDFKLSAVLKESVLKKVASNILAYFGNPESNFPEPERYQNRAKLYELALERLQKSTTKEEEDSARDEAAKASKPNPAPLAFIRERDFKVYYDQRKNNFFVLLQLIPATSNKIKKIKRDDGLKKFNDLSQGLPNTKTGILLPLEFGVWQEEFLKRQDIKFKTAELFKKGSEYYFNITCEVPEAQKLPLETFLGIDLGLKDAAAWTVLDKNGNVLKQEIFSGTERLATLRKHLAELREKQIKGKKVRGMRQKRRLEELAHLLANAIIKVALDFKSRIIMEDLKYIRTRSMVLKKILRRLVNAWNFDELRQILEYKTVLKGLPKPFFVRSHYTSQICPKCFDENGKPFYSKDNRVSPTQFKCIKCGYEAQANLNASENIVRRGLGILEKNA